MQFWFTFEMHLNEIYHINRPEENKYNLSLDIWKALDNIQLTY